MSAKTRAAAFLCARGLPTAAMMVATAVFAPFGAVAGLAGALVGAGAWAGTLRRRSTLLSEPRPFIGS